MMDKHKDDDVPTIEFRYMFWRGVVVGLRISGAVLFVVLHGLNFMPRFHNLGLPLWALAVWGFILGSTVIARILVDRWYNKLSKERLERLERSQSAPEEPTTIYYMVENPDNFAPHRN